MEAITWTDLATIFSAITSQFSITNVVGVISGALGISVVFSFMWFGAKKGMAILRTAINNGALSTGGKGRRR